MKISSTIAGCLSILALGLYSTPDAQAGAFGLYGSGGLTEGKAYYYREDLRQGIDSQLVPMFGAGFETLLGDKDDRLIGQLRIAWNRDMPISNPAVPQDDEHTYTHPDYETLPPRDDGLISVGLQWGLWGDPVGFQVVGVTALSSGFWTIDNLEYFTAEVGGGVTYTINDQIQFHGTVVASPRYRKQIYFATNTYAGVRYLFD